MALHRLHMFQIISKIEGWVPRKYAELYGISLKYNCSFNLLNSLLFPIKVTSARCVVLNTNNLIYSATPSRYPFLMAYIPTFNRALIILLIGQAITASTVPVLFLISGLLGPQLSPTLTLSTLPISLVVVGLAIGSPTSAWVMSRLGRKQGHILGLLVTLAGVGLAGLSLKTFYFGGFCFSSLIAGFGCAFNNQIRFTAAENAGDQKALVHSWILMFGLAAAIIGSWMIQFGRTLIAGGEYIGSLALLFGGLTLFIILMTTLPYTKSAPVEKQEPSGESFILKVLYQPLFWACALCGISSFVTMTLLMSSAPLQMHTICHISTSATTMTIQSHIIAMYFPSLFSGFLLTRFGLRKLIGFGILLFLICIGIADHSTSCHDYWWSMVLLGIGWNFLFLAGSTGISQYFTGPERFAAQGLNDTLVYGTQAIASLSAGWLLFTIGWSKLILIPIPILLGAFLFIRQYLNK